MSLSEQKAFDNYNHALEQAHKKITELTHINSKKNTKLLKGILALMIVLLTAISYHNQYTQDELITLKAKNLRTLKVNERLTTTKNMLIAVIRDRPQKLERDNIVPSDIAPSTLNIILSSIKKDSKMGKLLYNYVYEEKLANKIYDNNGGS